MAERPEPEVPYDEAIAQLKRLLDANLADESHNNVKVTFKGRRFFGDYYIKPETLRKAIGDE